MTPSSPLLQPAPLSTVTLQVQRDGGGSRQPDRGDGSFCNPIVAGDHPDPTLLKDGPDYYMTASSLQSCPGVLICHSRDLVNWTPITAALTQPLGSVSAMDLVRHGGRYFVYLPVLQGRRSAIYVIHAEDIRGPWSPPLDLGLDGCLDPSHVVGEDGRRHLFVNGARRIELSDDGLATHGELQFAHRIGQQQRERGTDLPVSEGPRLLRRGEFFYMISALATSEGHVLAVAKSRSVFGPWEDCPFNPIASAGDADAPWCTGGRVSLVEGPGGDWWMACHGHEHGYRTLGRQTLLQPIEWTRDGWFRTVGARLDRPMRKPRGGCGDHPAQPLSDDFRQNRLGLQWSFFDAGPGELLRARYADDGLLLRGKGSGPHDCSPLTCRVGDHSYVAELDFELDGTVQAGLALFHDTRGFVGIGIGDGLVHTYSYGQEHRWMRQPTQGRHHRLRMTHRRHLVSFHHAASDGPWTQNPWLRDISTLHQNGLGALLSLRPALFAAGPGEVRFRHFSYQSLDA
ncbi:family 43 glycosylhydrolase [Roseateles saccharophilus]|uniref:Xylan 1,4-beta-xylosidase n=1 Tax=Roseateles saccharophilus TaxID=304 RepID=A0A4R3VJJ5_ROSSA|nr:family 43 glycosylhydrolase [Roseateles saccharophilus]MDG0835464.1 xylan 1,4-beta-xylosidase [Roseateles saccharophilus]TCV04008.1 xylan 1,4-beta-xylosidase [Roseateles saccharophilus]